MKLDPHVHKSSDFEPFTQVWLIGFVLALQIRTSLHVWINVEKTGGKDGDIWLWKDLICTFRKSKKSRLSWLPLLYNRSRFVPVCRRCLSLHHRTKFPNWDIRNASTNSTPDFLLSFLATAKKQFQFFFLFNVFQRTCLPEGRRSVYSAKTNQQAHSIRWWLYNG